MALKPVISEDGSSTLFNPGLNEHYHSIHGALQESMHIFIRGGYSQLKNFQANIFEVGFGTGLNAFLTFLESEKSGREVHYSTIENDPIGDALVHELNYPEKTDPLKAATFYAIHDAPWGKDFPLSDNFTLHKIKGDLRFAHFKKGVYDLVYFDAFSPDVQPELWTPEVFRMLYFSMKEESSLITYSAKGSVKRALRAAGFIVNKLPGPPGKREITRAQKS